MKDRRRARAQQAALGLLVALLAVVSASCAPFGDGRPSADIEGLGSSIAEIQRLARREGELNLITWPEYAHRSWAGVFERQTGCEVSAREAASSDDMAGLIDAGGWDGVSASGSLSVPLMAEGRVAPLNIHLVPNYEQIEDGVKNQSFSSLDERPYGVPHGRVPMLLLFRTDVFPEETDSWSVLWQAPRRFQGRLSIFDDWISFADVAVYLKASRPELRIENPYELDERQFRAVVALVRRQAARIGQYWTRDPTAQVQSFTNGDSVVGTTWPRQVALLQQTNAPVRAIKPIEGTTGWSDTWMVNANADHPNCMYLWMDYVTSPDAQAKIGEFFELAPVNPVACELTENPDHCAELHADDEAWWSDVYYWTTPRADCGDDRGEVCKSDEDWKTAWSAIKARR